MTNNETMKKLQNLFKLSSKVTLIVPSTKNINEIIDNSEYVEKVATSFSTWFGGATSTPTMGYWTSPSVGLVKEKSVTVFAYCSDKDLQEHIDDIYQLGLSLKNELTQDAIALEINGEMYFI